MEKAVHEAIINDAVVNEWPDSQECIGCIHAIFIISEKPSTYLCGENCIASSLECKENRREASEEEWRSKF